MNYFLTYYFLILAFLSISTSEFNPLVWTFQNHKIQVFLDDSTLAKMKTVSSEIYQYTKTYASDKIEREKYFSKIERSVIQYGNKDNDVQFDPKIIPILCAAKCNVMNNIFFDQTRNIFDTEANKKLLENIINTQYSNMPGSVTFSTLNTKNNITKYSLFLIRHEYGDKKNEKKILYCVKFPYTIVKPELVHNNRLNITFKEFNEMCKTFDDSMKEISCHDKNAELVLLFHKDPSFDILKKFTSLPINIIYVKKLAIDDGWLEQSRVTFNNTLFLCNLLDTCFDQYKIVENFGNRIYSISFPDFYLNNLKENKKRNEIDNIDSLNQNHLKYYLRFHRYNKGYLSYDKKLFKKKRNNFPLLVSWWCDYLGPIIYQNSCDKISFNISKKDFIYSILSHLYLIENLETLIPKTHHLAGAAYIKDLFDDSLCKETLLPLLEILIGKSYCDFVGLTKVFIYLLYIYLLPIITDEACDCNECVTCTVKNYSHIRKILIDFFTLYNKKINYQDVIKEINNNLMFHCWSRRANRTNEVLGIFDNFIFDYFHEPFSRERHTRLHNEIDENKTMVFPFFMTLANELKIFKKNNRICKQMSWLFGNSLINTVQRHTHSVRSIIKRHIVQVLYIIIVEAALINIAMNFGLDKLIKGCINFLKGTWKIAPNEE